MANKVTSLIARIFGRAPVVPQRRDYAAARLDRLTASFAGSSLSADSNLRFSLDKMRARSRELAENNDYVAGYLELLGNKIIGPKGLRLQVRAKGGDGQLDQAANAAIEAAWADFGRRGVCDVTGRLSWVALQRLCLIAMAREGEVFVRLVRKKGINRFHCALQVLEADMVPTQLNDTLEDGHRIRMGVELDPYDKPVAYHVYTRHPRDYNFGASGIETVRIPAEEMIHLYDQLRPGQSRGVPWTAPVISRLWHIGGYDEAAVVAARAGAGKMGMFIEKDGASQFSGEKDSNGNFITEADPGSFFRVPLGYDFKEYDPSQPSGEYDGFMKRQLKGVSCGLRGATYAEISNDLESVSFSSIRSGSLNARDSYRTIQALLADLLCSAVYRWWLDHALAFGQIEVVSPKRGPNAKLSLANADKYAAHAFIGRGWEWVDPLKDIKANVEAIAQNLTSRSRIVAEMGEDYEDILAEIQNDKELAARYGVDLQPIAPAPVDPALEAQP